MRVFVQLIRYIWGGSLAKAKLFCQQIKNLGLNYNVIENLKDHVSKAYTISCATLNTELLIFGDLFQKDQYLDMVGAYRPDMREMDDH